MPTHAPMSLKEMRSELENQDQFDGCQNAKKGEDTSPDGLRNAQRLFEKSLEGGRKRFSSQGSGVAMRLSWAGTLPHLSGNHVPKVAAKAVPAGVV